MPTVAAGYFEAKARPVATLQAPRLAKSSCSFPFDARAKVKNYKHKKSCEGICYNNRPAGNKRRTHYH